MALTCMDAPPPSIDPEGPPPVLLVFLNAIKACETAGGAWAKGEEKRVEVSRGMATAE